MLVLPSMNLFAIPALNNIFWLYLSAISSALRGILVPFCLTNFKSSRMFAVEIRLILNYKKKSFELV